MALITTYSKYYSIVKNKVDKYYSRLKDELKKKYSREDLIRTIIAIIEKESRGNPNAIGDDYCSYGLMQLNYCAGTPQMYYNIKQPEELFNPDLNIDIGTQHLIYLLNKTNDLEKALVAYNAGLGRLGTSVEKKVRKTYVADILNYIKIITEKAVEFASVLGKKKNFG